jgi:hypothetical protein
MKDRNDPAKLAADLAEARRVLEETIVRQWDEVDTVLKRIEKHLRTMPSYSKAKKDREAEG